MNYLQKLLPKAYDNIRKTVIRQGDDYTTGCLMDYHHFKNTINWLQ